MKAIDVPKGQRKVFVYVWGSILLTLCYVVKCGAGEFAAFATALVSLVTVTGVTVTAERFSKSPEPDKPVTTINA